MTHSPLARNGPAAASVRTRRTLGPIVALLLGISVAQAQEAAEVDGDGGSAYAATEPSEAASPETVGTIPVDPPPTEEPVARRRAIEEIVVTATKRAESVRDIPASVTALKGEDLERRGAQGQDEFLKLVPGVTLYDPGFGTRRITVRGIASTNLTNETTGVFVGDVPFTEPSQPRVVLDPNPFDIATVEVLKGPQGTLFGGAALNGAVRYMPQQPVLGQWETKSFAQFASVAQGDSAMIYGGVVNIPVYGDDQLAFRLVGHDRRSSGWIDEFQRGEKDVNWIEQTGGRALALWQPGDRWKVTGMVMGQDTYKNDYPFANSADGSLSRSNTPRHSPINEGYDLQTIGIEHAFTDMTLLSQTAHTRKTFDARADISRLAGDRPPPGPVSEIDSHSDGYLQEFRLTSNLDSGSRWKWLAGAFAQKVEQYELAYLLGSDQPQPVNSGTVNPFPGFEGFITEDGETSVYHYVADVQVTELALFGEATSRFWDALDVTLGLRAYRMNTTGTVVSSGALAATEPGETEGVSHGDITEQGLNPKLAVQYDLNENMGLYVAASRGFRFGGIQFLADSVVFDAPDTYQSDTVWNYEVGLRTQWFDNTLVADVTPFYIDWKTPQLAQLDPSTVYSFVDNAGGARSSGVELAVQYLPPIDGLSVSFAGSYVDTVTTVPFTSAQGFAIPAGSRWPLTARHQTATTVAYERNVGDWVANASATHVFTGKVWIDIEQSGTAQGYPATDLMLNLDNPTLGWLPQLSLSLNNLLDKRALATNSPTTGDRVYIRPRTLILRLSSEF